MGGDGINLDPTKNDLFGAAENAVSGFSGEGALLGAGLTLLGGPIGLLGGAALGGGVGGILGGGEGRGGDPSQSPSGNAASKMAKGLFKETSGMRENIIGRGEKFLQGDFDPSQSPLFAPSKMALEQQFQTANDQARQSLPGGGVLQEQLGENIRSRAGDLTNMQGSIAQGEYDKIFGLATGTPALSLSALTGLAGGELSAQAQQQAAKSGMLGDLGQGVGSLFGGK